MDSGITTFTALRLNDKDVNDPNSGFYTTQATREQINAIPDNAKEPGELIYDKTTGNLVLYSQAEDEDTGAWKTLVTTASSDGEIEDTELIAKSHSTSQAPSAQTGLIYYNTDDKNFKAIDDDTAISGSHTKTIVTTPDHEGNLIAKSYRNATPSSTRDGLIYFDDGTGKKNFKVREEEGELRTMVTTKDDGGYLVVKTRNGLPDPEAHDGLIYYDPTDHNFKVRENSIINTIVTTPDSAGYFVAKNSGSDPTTAIDGQIYYNTQNKAFRGYSDGAWNYFALPCLYARYENKSGSSFVTYTATLPQNKVISIISSSATYTVHSTLGSFTPPGPSTTYPNGFTYNGSNTRVYIIATINYSIDNTTGSATSVEFAIGSKAKGDPADDTAADPVNGTHPYFVNAESIVESGDIPYANKGHSITLNYHFGINNGDTISLVATSRGQDVTLTVHSLNMSIVSIGLSL